MPNDPTAKVAGVLLKEVPLKSLTGFVSRMNMDAIGTGCGGGCGNNCPASVDRFGHILDGNDLRAAAADKPRLLNEIKVQAKKQAEGLGK